MMDELNNQTIVVPFDFSEASVTAYHDAKKWSEATSKIHVVHVIEPTPAIISLDPAVPIPPSYDQDRYEHSFEALKEHFAHDQDERLELHCIIGDPAPEIIALADNLEADMIIMPSHGRKGLSRWLLGSVAEKVIRSAKCPVLVLRGIADEGGAEATSDAEKRPKVAT